MSGIIQVDYDGLARIAAQFSRQSDSVATLRSRLDRSAEELLSQGWSGRGSEAFAAEYARISATLQQLSEILQQAAGICATDIPDRYRTAEEEAAAPFQGDYQGVGAGSAGSAAAADDTGSSAARTAEALAAFDQPTTFSDDVGLPPELYLTGTSSLADLFRMNAQQYDAAPGELEESLRIFQTGENRYLVSIMGTDNDYPFTLAGWRNNALSGLGVDSWYTDRIAEAVSQLPADAHIDLVGHSQGGHVANLIANRADITERFTVDSVTTFGSFSNTRINPAIGPQGYHSFITADDWMNPADRGAVSVHEYLFDPAPDRPFIENRILDHHSGGHGGYGESAQLAAMPLPFPVDRFEPVAAHTIADTSFNSVWRPVHHTLNAGEAVLDVAADGASSFADASVTAARGMAESSRSVGRAMLDLPGNLWDAGAATVRGVGSLFD